MDTETRRGIRLGLRLAMVHHPLCAWFHDDAFGRGRLRVCAGCAVMWPAFVLGLILGVAAVRSVAIDPWALLAGALVLGLPHLSTYVARRDRLWRGLAKGIGGLGLGLVVAAGLLLPVDAAWKVLGYLGLGLVFAALQGVRLGRILHTCQSCPWRMDWAHCPGFDPERSSRPDRAGHALSAPVRLELDHESARRSAHLAFDAHRTSTPKGHASSSVAPGDKHPSKDPGANRPRAPTTRTGGV